MNEDIRPSSWNELIQILYDIPRDQYIQRHRSNYVYRGLANKEWKLETSLIRLGGDYEKLERPILRSFVKYAEPGTLLSENLWMRLAIAQHHGLPTRLMDWTVSPRVALHFATAESEHYDKDGIIWCIDTDQTRQDIPERFWDILKEEYAHLFSIEMLVSMSLEELDKFLSQQNQEFVFFFEPPSLDARIVNQGAILSAMPGAKLILSEYLYKNPDFYKRIIIPKELKWEIRDKLDQDNITERSLFPGLDGLSRWLKRHYGPGEHSTMPSTSQPPTG